MQQVAGGTVGGRGWEAPQGAGSSVGGRGLSRGLGRDHGSWGRCFKPQQALPAQYTQPPTCTMPPIVSPIGPNPSPSPDKSPRALCRASGTPPSVFFSVGGGAESTGGACSRTVGIRSREKGCGSCGQRFCAGGRAGLYSGQHVTTPSTSPPTTMPPIVSPMGPNPSPSPDRSPRAFCSERAGESGVLVAWRRTEGLRALGRLTPKAELDRECSCAMEVCDIALLACVAACWQGRDKENLSRRTCDPQQISAVGSRLWRLGRSRYPRLQGTQSLF